jgi:NAD(P)-dependent dehydrogenase (short-subunit alcohol dehydrogenase family)
MFNHDRLDLLMCNAGIMDVPPEVSVDGYEIHFATNHLGHSMLIQQLLPILLRTAEKPATDVRIVILTSLGWRIKSSAGIAYDTLETKQEGGLTSIYRYGYVKS